MKYIALILTIIMSATIVTSCVNSKKVNDEDRIPANERVWTNWYNKSTQIGKLLGLAKLRDNLRDNVIDPHVDYKPTVKGREGENLNCGNARYRSADGTCYFSEKGKEYVGAAGVAFGRNVKAEFIDNSPREQWMQPNPAVVSKAFLTREFTDDRELNFPKVPFLNLIAASWIQFMNHDWITHGKNEQDIVYTVDKADKNVSLVEESQKGRVSLSSIKKPFKRRVTANEVTHWWDGSQIYGSNLKEQMSLRKPNSFGLLKTDLHNGREILPQDRSFNAANNRQNQGAELTGFRDNWWVGLSMLHTLFVKEHNHIAKGLYNKYVKYNKSSGKYIWKESDRGAKAKSYTKAELDEHIFQVSRLVNAAVMAKIHTVEWTPGILKNDTLAIAMCANWFGLVNPVSFGGKCTRGRSHRAKVFKNYNVGSIVARLLKNKDLEHILGGIIGGRRDNLGVPYSLTEEFTSVYRLHSLLPEYIELRKRESWKSNKQYTAVASKSFDSLRNEKSIGVMKSNDLSNLFYSFGTQLPGQLILNNFPKFMQNLTIPGRDTNMDLGMVDIIRDRERGVPRYNQFRRAIDLKPVNKYEDFFEGGIADDPKEKEVLAKLREVYGLDSSGNDNVEDIDLLIGTLAESPGVRPHNFGFGETMFQIFVLMASRRLMADPFFTEKYNAKYYTRFGIDYVDFKGRLDQVIVRHMPQLASNIEGLDSAFEPWHFNRADQKKKEREENRRNGERRAREREAQIERSGK